MRWGENKNAHPRHGTDVESVVPPNLGCCQPRSPGTTITGIPWLYNGSIPSPLL